MRTYIAEGAGEMSEVARAILRDFPGARVFVLNGDLGAGKTTLVQAFCRQLGIAGPITSPTFSIVHTYEAGHRVHHFDLYRLEDANDLHQIGFEEYLADGKSYIFIEWPAIAQSLMPDEYLILDIKYQGANGRSIHGKRANNS